MLHHDRLQYRLPSGELNIPLMQGISPELMQVNTRDDIRRWWEVMDRTEGSVVPTDFWRYDEAEGSVVIARPKPFHDYTVSFPGLSYLGSCAHVQCRHQQLAEL